VVHAGHRRAGQNRVVPLPPEFVVAQDGQEKQDCELAAAKRWLTAWGSHYPRRITLLGDDLYCHQPFCEAVRQQQMDFLLRLQTRFPRPAVRMGG